MRRPRVVAVILAVQFFALHSDSAKAQMSACAKLEQQCARPRDAAPLPHGEHVHPHVEGPGVPHVRSLGACSVKQWQKLQTDESLGPIEVVWFSHAHNDHYDGIYDLPLREKFQTWTLDAVALPLSEPLKLAGAVPGRPARRDRSPAERWGHAHLGASIAFASITSPARASTRWASKP